MVRSPRSPSLPHLAAGSRESPAGPKPEAAEPRPPRGAGRYPPPKTSAATLLVNETFLSIQGEGPEQGYPTFFIRLAGCNLRCTYCDTAYAYFEGRRRDLCDVVEEARRSGVPRVLVTGGEPMAQAATPILCGQLLRAHLRVTLETNGSFPLDGLPRGLKRVVDVKAPGSGECGSFLPSILPTLGRGDSLKFVLTDRSDYLWTRDYLEEHLLPPGVEAFLSPVWAKLDPQALADWMLRDRLGARMQMQLHKVLWGEKREK